MLPNSALTRAPQENKANKTTESNRYNTVRHQVQTHSQVSTAPRDSQPHLLANVSERAETSVVPALVRGPGKPTHSL